jgi:hypothetical protein
MPPFFAARQLPGCEWATAPTYSTDAAHEGHDHRFGPRQERIKFTVSMSAEPLCFASSFGAFDHRVKMMAPQFVKPYVKTNKHDSLDAEAICDAVTRPNMRFVPAKSPDYRRCNLGGPCTAAADAAGLWCRPERPEEHHARRLVPDGQGGRCLWLRRRAMAELPAQCRLPH